MRIVLIIQSLIILAGAYYVYTLTRSPDLETDDFAASSTIEIQTRVESADSQPEIVEESDTTNTQGEVIITDGHNDLGMEFPIPDNEDLEVR